MAFIKAGDNQRDPEAAGDNTGGFPLTWSNLAGKCCPKCGEELQEFDHLKLWACVCGFRISTHKLEVIAAEHNAQEYGAGKSRGWGFGKDDYNDLTPF